MVGVSRKTLRETGVAARVIVAAAVVVVVMVVVGVVVVVSAAATVPILVKRSVGIHTQRDKPRSNA